MSSQRHLSLSGTRIRPSRSKGSRVRGVSKVQPSVGNLQSRRHFAQPAEDWLSDGRWALRIKGQSVSSPSKRQASGNESAKWPRLLALEGQQATAGAGWPRHPAATDFSVQQSESLRELVDNSESVLAAAQEAIAQWDRSARRISEQREQTSGAPDPRVVSNSDRQPMDEASRPTEYERRSNGGLRHQGFELEYDDEQMHSGRGSGVDEAVDSDYYSSDGGASDFALSEGDEVPVTEFSLSDEEDAAEGEESDFEGSSDEGSRGPAVTEEMHAASLMRPAQSADSSERKHRVVHQVAQTRGLPSHPRGSPVSRIPQLLQRPALSAVRARTAKRSPVRARHPMLSTRQSPLATRQSSAPTKRSPVPAKRSPMPAKRSPMPAKRSPVPAKRSPVPAKRSPADRSPPRSLHGTQSPSPGASHSPYHSKLDGFMARVQTLAARKHRMRMQQAARAAAQTALCRQTADRSRKPREVLREAGAGRRMPVPSLQQAARSHGVRVRRPQEDDEHTPRVREVLPQASPPSPASTRGGNAPQTRSDHLGRSHRVHRTRGSPVRSSQPVGSSRQVKPLRYKFSSGKQRYSGRRRTRLSAGRLAPPPTSGRGPTGRSERMPARSAVGGQQRQTEPASVAAAPNRGKVSSRALSEALLARREQNQKLRQTQWRLAVLHHRRTQALYYGLRPWMRALEWLRFRQRHARQYYQRHVLLQRHLHRWIRRYRQRYWRRLFARAAGQCARLAQLKSDRRQRLLDLHHERWVHKCFVLLPLMRQRAEKHYRTHRARRLFTGPCFNAWALATRDKLAAQQTRLQRIEREVAIPMGRKVRRRYYFARWMRYLEQTLLDRHRVSIEATLAGKLRSLYGLSVRRSPPDSGEADDSAALVGDGKEAVSMRSASGVWFPRCTRCLRRHDPTVEDACESLSHQESGAAVVAQSPPQAVDSPAASSRDRHPRPSSPSGGTPPVAPSHVAHGAGAMDGDSAVRSFLSQSSFLTASPEDEKSPVGTEQPSPTAPPSDVDLHADDVREEGRFLCMMRERADYVAASAVAETRLGHSESAALEESRVQTAVLSEGEGANEEKKFSPEGGEAEDLLAVDGRESAETAAADRNDTRPAVHGAEEFEVPTSAESVKVDQPGKESAFAQESGAFEDEFAAGVDVSPLSDGDGASSLPETVGRIGSQRTSSQSDGHAIGSPGKPSTPPTVPGRLPSGWSSPAAVDAILALHSPREPGVALFGSTQSGAADSNDAEATPIADSAMGGTAEEISSTSPNEVGGPLFTPVRLTPAPLMQGISPPDTLALSPATPLQRPSSLHEAGAPEHLQGSPFLQDEVLPEDLSAPDPSNASPPRSDLCAADVGNSAVSDVTVPGAGTPAMPDARTEGGGDDMEVHAASNMEQPAELGAAEIRLRLKALKRRARVLQADGGIAWFPLDSGRSSARGVPVGETSVTSTARNEPVNDSGRSGLGSPTAGQPTYQDAGSDGSDEDVNVGHAEALVDPSLAQGRGGAAEPCDTGTVLHDMTPDGGSNREPGGSDRAVVVSAAEPLSDHSEYDTDFGEWEHGQPHADADDNAAVGGTATPTQADPSRSQVMHYRGGSMTPDDSLSAMSEPVEALSESSGEGSECLLEAVDGSPTAPIHTPPPAERVRRWWNEGEDGSAGELDGPAVRSNPREEQYEPVHELERMGDHHEPMFTTQHDDGQEPLSSRSSVEVQDEPSHSPIVYRNADGFHRILPFQGPFMSGRWDGRTVPSAQPKKPRTLTPDHPPAGASESGGSSKRTPRSLPPLDTPSLSSPSEVTGTDSGLDAVLRVRSVGRKRPSRIPDWLSDPEDDQPPQHAVTPSPSEPEQEVASNGVTMIVLPAEMHVAGASMLPAKQPAVRSARLRRILETGWVPKTSARTRANNSFGVVGSSPDDGHVTVTVAPEDVSSGGNIAHSRDTAPADSKNNEAGWDEDSQLQDQTPVAALDDGFQFASPGNVLPAPLLPSSLSPSPQLM